MKELELTEDIIVKLGLDPKKGWGEMRVDGSGEIYVQGVCGAGDENYSCPVRKTVIYNADTGAYESAECPTYPNPNSNLCYRELQGKLQVGEK
ncbi:hypothetical protein IID22_04510 [Patescibacteria group bacterium]|nr:hypothetical protein [Patescibacteria group bacterium]